MSNERQSASFSIDGYEVSATFASAGDPAALNHAKQILLSTFVASNSKPGGIFAISPEQRDNIGEGTHMHLENCIYPMNQKRPLKTF